MDCVNSVTLNYQYKHGDTRRAGYYLPLVYCFKY